MRTVVTYLMIVILLSLLVACGGEPAAEVAETEAPTEEAAPATEEPTETPEPEPTDTPEPTPTPTEDLTALTEEPLAAADASFEAGDFEAAIEGYTAVLDIDDRNIEAYTGRAYALTALDRYDEAMADFDTAIEIDAENPLIYARRAAFYRLQDDYETALAEVEQALDLDDALAEAYYQRGRIYAAQDEYEAAIAEYDRAIELNPEGLYYYTNRAIAYRLQEDYEAALADVEQVLELDDAFAEAYYQRGRIYAAQDEDEAALAEYDRAIELDGEQAGYYNSRGLAREGLDDDDGALEDYNTSIDVDPDYKWPYKNRADIYRLRDEYDEALTNYTAAIDLDPDYDTAYYNRGRTYAEMEDYEAALADFSAAIEIDPEYANAYKRRADVYAALEDEEQAIADWQMYFDVAEDLEDKVEAADELAAYDIAVEFPPIEVELETFEHPSGAFSVSVPVEAVRSTVDEASMSMPLNVGRVYDSAPDVESTLKPLFVVVAGVVANPTGETLDEFDSQEVVGMMFPDASITAEILTEERLDDQRILLEVAVDDPNNPLNRAELLVEDGGDSLLMLMFMTNSFSTFESTWTEIFESYTFDPAGAAEALEAAAATQAEAEAQAEAAAAAEEQAAESGGATGQAVPLQMFEHPSGAFSLKVPVGTEAMPSEITIDDPEVDGPHNMSTGYFNPESFFEFFVLMAAAGPSETMFEGQSVDQVGEEIVGTLGLGDSEGVELVGQRELADGSLLIELEQTDEGTSVRMEIVVAEQADAKFMLIFMTTNYDMFEATWLEILDSYTFNPEAVAAN